MCCFSGEVSQVADTQIFARASGDAQILVYSMSILANHEVAMILPLPVPPQSPEDAVRFINLEAYPTFFRDLDVLFSGVRMLGSSLSDAPAPAGPRLAVHAVGKFEASFVPTITDFARLEPRFRLPATLWQELPQYSDWGFAVFKLKPSPAAPPGPTKASIKKTNASIKKMFDALFGVKPAQAEPAEPEAAPHPAAAEPHRVHPMALLFPRRDPKQLFFPTIHIHDGKIHAEAHFDHVLYFQLDRMFTGMQLPGADSRDSLKRWGSLDLYLSKNLERAMAPVEDFMDLRCANGTLLPAMPLYRWKLTGPLPNQDSILDL